jgi:hypothetical protein
LHGVSFLTVGAQNKNVVVGGCGNLHSSVLAWTDFDTLNGIWNFTYFEQHLLSPFKFCVTLNFFI